jgi:hypothetical protein
MIGRAMIAHTLMPLEKDDELNVIYNGGNALEDRHKRRWYHYLFNQMLTSGASLVDNRLSIITFNFDRSFERAFFRFVRGVHGGNEGTLNKICQSIKIEHIHGQLGAPNWLEASGGRRFGCAEVDPDELMHCAEAIRIAHQEIDPEVLKRARALIAEAKHVCFLGFSYHPLNLIKLDVSTIIGDGRNVVGTSFEMPTGQRGAAVRHFTRNGSPMISLEDSTVDILDFLKRTPIIHE